jgi:hypothetical protein
MTGTQSPLIHENGVDTVHASQRVSNYIWASTPDGVDDEEAEQGRSWVMACAIHVLEHHAAQLVDAAHPSTPDSNY